MYSSILFCPSPKYLTKTEMNKFLPLSEQFLIIKKIIGRAASQSSGEIDPITNNYFCGNRLIERTAQILAGGVATPIDYSESNVSTLNLRELGQKVRSYYTSHRGNVIGCNENKIHLPDNSFP